jgi:MFS transporter, DHA2 family, methylenomycin A resistance protein
LGFGAGPIIGGLLLAAFDWTAVFWVNVPFGVLGILLTLFFVRESRDPNARRLDVGGAVLVSAGLVCLTVALVETDDHAWFSVFTLSFLALAAVLLAAFVAYEARHAHPMVPLEFFRRRVFASANAVYALMYASLGAMLFFTTLYLQNVQRHSALVTGLAFLFLNIPFLLIAPFAARIQRRFGSGRVIVVGTLVTGLGLSGLAFLDVDSSFAAIVPPFILVGIGFGLAAPALPSVGMAAIGPEHGGVASGVINTSRQIGAAIGLASVGSISLQVVTRAWGDYVDTLPSSAQSEASSLTGAVVGGEGHEVGVSLGASAAAEAFDAFRLRVSGGNAGGGGSHAPRLPRRGHRLPTTVPLCSFGSAARFRARAVHCRRE